MLCSNLELANHMRARGGGGALAKPGKKKLVKSMMQRCSDSAERAAISWTDGTKSGEEMGDLQEAGPFTTLDQSSS
jgi:hypothetical protein